MANGLYMAPEVLSRGLLTEKADVFSFGAVLFEMITGTEPYSSHWPEGEFTVCSAMLEWNLVPHLFVTPGPPYCVRSPAPSWRTVSCNSSRARPGAYLQDFCCFSICP